MEFPNEHILEDIYDTGIVADVGVSDKYKELRRKYNELYDSIESEELKNKFSSLEEIKTELYSENDKQLYKIGFSMATKILIEALTCEI